MIGEFFVERFVQHDDRFGIKVTEPDVWINGFKECPQVIKEQEVNKIPYYTSQGKTKAGVEKTFYNYGEAKRTAQEQIDELRDAIKELWTEIGKLNDKN